MSCPLCNSIKIQSFIKRYNVPIYQNSLIEKQEDAINIKRGDIDLSLCKKCGFIFNSRFDPARINYDSKYDNNQSYSPYFENYIDSLIKCLINQKGVNRSKIVEIGCGKGFFLKKLVEATDLHNTGYGYDPTYVGPDYFYNGKLIFKKELFNSKTFKNKNNPDVIICRHVIEHIPEPIQFLNSIYDAISKKQNSIVVKLFFETPSVEWILTNNAIWDIFYEHCSYFSRDTLLSAMEKANFNVEQIISIFNQQYFWCETNTKQIGYCKRDSDINKIINDCRNFGNFEKDVIKFWFKKLTNLRKKGSVALWGAGAKGVTFANLIDPEQKLISCIVDLNPNKQGCFLPGTGHPIIDYHDLSSFEVKTAIQMNPNYTKECLLLLKNASLNINLIDTRNNGGNNEVGY